MGGGLGRWTSDLTDLRIPPCWDPIGSYTVYALLWTLIPHTPIGL